MGQTELTGHLGGVAPARDAGTDSSHEDTSHEARWKVSNRCKIKMIKVQFSAESKGKIESPDMRSISGRWVRVLHPGHLLAEGS